MLYLFNIATHLNIFVCVLLDDTSMGNWYTGDTHNYCGHECKYYINIKGVLMVILYYL